MGMSLWKQEKCSSLAQPKGNFNKTTWAWQGIKLTADKIWPKKDKEIEVSPLMQIRVKYLAASSYHYENKLTKNIRSTDIL